MTIKFALSGRPPKLAFERCKPESQLVLPLPAAGKALIPVWIVLRLEEKGTGVVELSLNCDKLNQVGVPAKALVKL